VAMGYKHVKEWLDIGNAIDSHNGGLGVGCFQTKYHGSMVRHVVRDIGGEIVFFVNRLVDCQTKQNG